MKHTFTILTGLSVSLCASFAMAQEPAATEAQTPEVCETASCDKAAVDTAVQIYHLQTMYRYFIVSADMLEDAAYDDNVVAGAAKLLEITESTPTDGLPASYVEYLQAKNARQRKSIEQIQAIMNGRSEDELDAKDLAALKVVLEESQAEFAELARKYPEAEAALGDAASQLYTQKITKELKLQEKTRQFILEHPEVTAGGPEAAIAASMRFTAEEISKHIETLQQKK